MEEYGMALEWGTWYVDPDDIGWLDRLLIRWRLKPYPAPVVIPKPPNAIEILSNSAAGCLPPGTRFEIREMVPFDYGRRRGMAWYSTPQMSQEHMWNDPQERDRGPHDGLGYRVLHRLVT